VWRVSGLGNVGRRGLGYGGAIILALGMLRSVTFGAIMMDLYFTNNTSSALIFGLAEQGAVSSTEPMYQSGIIPPAGVYYFGGMAWDTAYLPVGKLFSDYGESGDWSGVGLTEWQTYPDFTLDGDPIGSVQAYGDNALQLGYVVPEPTSLSLVGFFFAGWMMMMVFGGVGWKLRMVRQIAAPGSREY